MAASVIFWDFGITDSITDMHRTYQGNIVIPVPANRTGQVSDSVSGERVSAIEYYGEAEEEVNTKTYDKNLWAKAFVQAEGDEQKRVAKYIELRANQLYSENVSSISKSNLNEQPTVDTEVSGTGITATRTKVESPVIADSRVIDISGTYIAETTASGGGPAIATMRIVKKMNGKLIVLKQTGNTITGSVSFQSNWIKGTREGNIINFYGYYIGGWTIDGSWEINADATNLEGKWFTDGGGGASGKWNLTRVE